MKTVNSVFWMVLMRYHQINKPHGFTAEVKESTFLFVDEMMGFLRKDMVKILTHYRHLPKMHNHIYNVDDGC